MAKNKQSTGQRCDRELKFDNGPSIYDHAIHTGHMEVRTCVPCRKVFGGKKVLSAHQASSLKHKTTPAAHIPTTTTITTDSNSQKRIATKDKEVNNPTPTRNSDNPRGSKQKKKEGNSTKPNAASQGSVAVNTPSCNTAVAQGESRSARNPSTSPMFRRARKRGRENITQMDKKEPATHTPVSTSAIGQAGVAARTTTASVSSASVGFGFANDGKKGQDKQIPQAPCSSSTTASTTGQVWIPAKYGEAGASSLQVAGPYQATQQKESVNASQKLINQSCLGAAQQVVANTTSMDVTLASQQHGQVDTKYSWISPPENPAIFFALSQLCHNTKRLRSEGYPGCMDRRIITSPSSRFLAAPDHNPLWPKRRAVALDCEMVEVASRRSELVRLCALDLVTGELLIDALVEPTERVVDWRTRYSGVSRRILARVKASGPPAAVLAGWPAARARLFDFVDADTVLAGHALHNDLRVLGVAHARVVDSAIVTAEAAFGAQLRRKWALRKLAKELLGLTIQDSDAGHDCVEDALATREVLLWCVRRPLMLAEWGAAAAAAWEKETAERAERQRKKALEKKEKAAAAAASGRQVDEDHEFYDDYDPLEVVSREEFLEMAELPLGYDPSSW